MRRKHCLVSDPEEIAKILGRCRIGRLATVGEDGYPYITPVNYVFWQGSVYFHSARQGEKIDNLKRDSKVCFEVDLPLAYLDTGFDTSRPPCSVHQFYHSVVIRGRAEIVEEADEKVAALNALMTAHESDGGIPFTAIDEGMEAVAACLVVAVRVESISAKSDLAQNKDEATRTRIADYLESRGMANDREAAQAIRDSR